MRTFNIPLIWQEWGTVQVEAETLEEAKAKALGPDVPLPAGSYIDDSLEIDEDGLEFHNQTKEERNAIPTA